MTNGKPLLELREVYVNYHQSTGNSVTVLDNFNLTLHENEIVAVVGVSGVGKTTALRVISGLTRPSSGKVLWHGQEHHGINPRAGIVFQEVTLYPWLTVAENVEFGLYPKGYDLRTRRQRVAKAIDSVGLEGFEEAYPRELSGGMRQRVGIARALAVHPEVLCLDEPFSSVDVLTAENLRAEVVDIWKEKSEAVKSVVLVTHNISEAVVMAQRIFVYGTDPGHVRTVLSNQLPYPRDPKDPKFQELVNVIHAVITEALIPEEVDRPLPVQPSWYQGLESLPAVGPSEIIGLLEVLDNAGGKMDMFKVAAETGSEFGHCLAVTKTAELLDFVDTPKQTVVFTDLGRRFVRADTQARKELFSAQIKHLRIFQTLLAWLEESPDKEIQREEVMSRLQTYFPNEKLETLFDTLVAFGRYGEILSYNAKLGVLTFPAPEEEMPHEETTSETT